MHPALSIILFTTVSGLGFGLIAWLGLGAVPDPAQKTAAVLAFVLAAAGLSASTFHLGHPERAWRALSQWRSSWLSREGVMAVLTLGLLVLWWLLGFPAWLGYIVSVAALLTVYTTSMIYAQMRSVRQWNTGLTPLVFILLAMAGGGLLAALCAAWVDASGAGLLIGVLVLSVGAWLAKYSWWRRSDADIELSDPSSATGLAGRGQVRLLESPHSGGSYLLTEMGFKVGRKHAARLRQIALLAGGILPVLALTLCLLVSDSAAWVLVLAVILHIIGLLAERWLFFAQARHAVMSFYE